MQGVKKMADDRLIVALDVHTMEDVKSLVEKIGDAVSYYKVGMELFYSVGAGVVTYLKEQNKKVFLDLKLCDIPNTVAGGLTSLMNLGADMMNIHSFGGFAMMEKAAESVREAAEKANKKPPKLIAVTVLTSISEDEWKEMGHNTSIEEQVLIFAKLAKKAGLDGVVASPKEAAAIRNAVGEDFLIVTPGVRPKGASVDDQNRIATPAGALKNGATHLVVGRPVRAAEDPKLAAENIIKEMSEAE